MCEPDEFRPDSNDGERHLCDIDSVVENQTSFDKMMKQSKTLKYDQLDECDHLAAKAKVTFTLLKTARESLTLGKKTGTGSIN